MSANRRRFNLNATWKKIDRKITEHNRRIGPTGKKYGKTCREKIKESQRSGIRDIVLAYIRAYEKGANRSNAFWVTLSYLAKMSEGTKTDRTCNNHIEKAMVNRILVLTKKPGRKNFGTGMNPCVVIEIDTNLLVFDDPQLQIQFEKALQNVGNPVDELTEAEAAALVKSALERNGTSPP